MMKRDESRQVDSLLNADMNFAVVEAYKEIRANIGFALPGPGSKVIMVTSALVGEGKSTTTVNLAATFAQTKAKVLLIDADIRKPTTHSILGIDSTIGLSDYLSGIVELSDAIIDTPSTTLKFLQAGNIHKNPGELLGSDKMKETINILREVFDYIFIDTPPICVVADALPLSKSCDGVILVVKQMQSTYRTVGNAVDKLKFANANIIGTVLNRINVKNTTKYYKYNYRGYYKTKYGSYNYGGTKSEPKDIKETEESSEKTDKQG